MGENDEDFCFSLSDFRGRINSETKVAILVCAVGQKNRMAKTKANEREFQGQALAWIKKQIEQGGLSFKNATNDSSLYGLSTVRFPDVLVTLDFECQKPFCGWELKTPATDARDKGLLENAVEKAQRLNAKYFVGWDMQTAIIWRTPEKTRATVQEKDKVREFGPDPRIQSVDDIRDPQKALIMEGVCAQILRDLARLYKDENINLPLADTTVFVGSVANASKLMSEAMIKDINKARAKKDFDKRLNAWAKLQGVSKYDQDYYKTLAQQVAYKIVGKILFYMTLRRHNLDLPRMELPTKSYKTAMNRMRSLFQQALEVDYQAIFEPDITDEIELSADTAKVIIELTEKLEHWSFELMPLDVIGAVFEKLISEDARHSLGQYFTPANLVDLIVSFCVSNGDDFVMDPTCGTGTFLIRSYNRLRYLGVKRKSHHELLNQVWGFDIAGFPAELATINLCRQDFSDYLNFPRVLARDFFDVLPRLNFEFPPPKKILKAGERERVAIPKFDALVGNFPYIRQELIEKANKGYKKKLEKVLFESWGKDYSVLFNNNAGNSRVKTEHKLRLSGQADIYAYLFFHTAAHLKVGGRMGFITSNSWLDVAYGYELQKFFLSKFKLVGIFESRCEPWFEQSSVNTVFTILERCDDEQEKKDNPVYFVKVKKPLSQLFPQDALTDAQARWNGLDAFVEKIEEIGTRWQAIGGEKFKKFERIDADYVKQPEIISYEDEQVRVRMIRQDDLKKQVDAAEQTVRWGQYLRGPDIYFEILEKCANKLVTLGKMDVDIQRGITTGKNEFFYLTEDQIKHWGIEREFVKPVVTSTKEIDGVFVEPDKVAWRAFVCDKSKKELTGTNAIRYIKEGERKKWCDVPSVRNRPQWWTLPKQEGADFLILRFIDRRHYAPVNQANILVGDVVFVGGFESREYAEFGFAAMNSVLIALFAEVFGRVNLGDGLLTTYGPEIKALLLPSKEIATKESEAVLEAFQKLGRRDIMPFSEEVKKKDRREFESKFFKCLGLTQEDFERVYVAVNELIEERHLLPKLRNLKKKKRIVQDLEKLKDEIVEEVLPDGTIRFPEGFVKGWPKIQCDEIGVPAGKLKLGESFFDKQEICDEEGKHFMEVATEERAKFIVYAKKKDELVIKIPESSVAIKKAVQGYEFYVKELKDKLYTAFMDKCGDHSLSENVTRQVFEGFGLPYI